MTDGDLVIPDGSQTSSEPIEGGICMLNAAFPPGDDQHEVWRTPTNAELADADDRRRAWAVQSTQARWAMLRIERNRRLTETDWVELPSAAHRLDAAQLAAWMTYRQQLRDLPAVTVDPDEPTWPTAPGSTNEALQQTADASATVGA